MADYFTTENDLKTVANAIRTKTGGSTKLTYPDGFANAILGISSGIDTSDATASASDITKGKTAYVNATKITGTKELIKNVEGVGTSTLSYHEGTTSDNIEYINYYDENGVVLPDDWQNGTYEFIYPFKVIFDGGNHTALGMLGVFGFYDINSAEMQFQAILNIGQSIYVIPNTSMAGVEEITEGYPALIDIFAIGDTPIKYSIDLYIKKDMLADLGIKDKNGISQTYLTDQLENLSPIIITAPNATAI